MGRSRVRPLGRIHGRAEAYLQGSGHLPPWSFLLGSGVRGAWGRGVRESHQPLGPLPRWSSLTGWRTDDEQAPQKGRVVPKAAQPMYVLGTGEAQL